MIFLILEKHLQARDDLQAQEVKCDGLRDELIAIYKVIYLDHGTFLKSLPMITIQRPDLTPHAPHTHTYTLPSLQGLLARKRTELTTLMRELGMMQLETFDSCQRVSD